MEVHIKRQEKQENVFDNIDVGPNNCGTEIMEIGLSKSAMAIISQINCLRDI